MYHLSSDITASGALIESGATNVEVTCTITGPTTAPTVSWFWGATDVSSEPGYSVGSVSQSGDTATSVLTIEKAPVSGEAYTCYVSGTEFAFTNDAKIVEFKVYGNF